jgi:hypothetical protein
LVKARTEHPIKTAQTKNPGIISKILCSHQSWALVGFEEGKMKDIGKIKIKIKIKIKNQNVKCKILIFDFYILI